MRGRRRLFSIAAAALLLVHACVSHRKASLATLSDYSDGVSVFAERFHEDWKTGATNSGLYAPGFSWRGPLPGDGLTAAPLRGLPCRLPSTGLPVR